MEYTSSADRLTRDYFDSLLLEPRYLDSGVPSTRLDLYGETFSTPIMTAALSHLHNTVPDGMAVYAAGAAQANAVHWMGMGADEELESVVATGARTIKVIKPHADNALVFHKIEHAVASGCLAVGMDIDHPFTPDGQFDVCDGFPLKAKSTEELAEFVQAAGVPFIAKGVLSPQDAEKCLKAGCAGIVVSHHHGMIPYSIPPLMALESIVDVIDRQIPIFVDCGIESGVDAYKALALGATAVSVGRHLMSFLKDGPDTVAARINQMTAELAGIMAKTGVSSLDQMDSTVIHRRQF